MRGYSSSSVSELLGTGGEGGEVDAGVDVESGAVFGAEVDALSASAGLSTEGDQNQAIVWE